MAVLGVDDNLYVPGTQVTVAGWGSTSANDHKQISTVLRHATLKVIPKLVPQCIRFWNPGGSIGQLCDLL